jgi:hypothetical protein
MMTCETCQALLLPHLYGLLDDAERQEVVGHLAGCGGCAAAVERARQQQQTLAAAAKSSFPDVRFAPVDRPAAASAPTLKFEGAAPARPRRWARWAVAACVLLLLGCSAAFGTIAYQRYGTAAARAQEELLKAEAARLQYLAEQAKQDEALKDDVAKIEQQIKLIEAQFRDDLGRVQTEYQNQNVQFNITHPKTIQAGGVNKLTVETRRKEPAAKFKYHYVAQVVDEKSQRELHRQPLEEGKATEVLLPPGLPLEPGSRVSLRILAVEDRGVAAFGAAVAGGWGALGSDPFGQAAAVLVSQAQQTVIHEMLPLVTSLYVTHLTTDRPLYRPGETVYFRSLTLERAGFKPADVDLDLRFQLVDGKGQPVQVLDPVTGKPAQLTGVAQIQGTDGKALLGPDGKAIKGVGAGAFRLPDDALGGEYTLTVSDGGNRFPPEKRKFLVNHYQAPRLNKDVDLNRKSYGPGDTVTALCKVAPVEGGRVLSYQPVFARATVDGVECKLLTKAPVATDERGECLVQFRLPEHIERGEGVLSVTFSDGANRETTVEVIPIVLKKLHVHFYPEGGELVAGVPNRVYFTARTTLNKPAQMHGRILDKDGNTVATIQTLSDDKELGVNQGCGLFDFTPQAGQSYRLHIDAPLGIADETSLPPLQTSGVALHAVQGVVTDKIDLVLASAGKDRKLLVGAYCRGLLLAQETVTAPAGVAVPLTLTPNAATAGVCRVTVFEVDGGKLTPLAERLLYRRSPEKLNLQVFAKAAYTPGERVTLSLSATDEHHKAMPAIVVVSVVDKAIIKMRNDRTARSMPTHFLLASEVRGPEDLEYADFLLLETPRTPLGLELARAQVALDLLLGTQGWRRFLEQRSLAEQTQAHKEAKLDVERLWQEGGRLERHDTPLTAKVNRAVERVRPAHEALVKQLAEKEAKQDAQQVAYQAGRNEKEGQKAVRQQEFNEAEAELAGLGKTAAQVALAVLVIALCVLGMVLVFVGLIRANAGRQRAMGYLWSGVACFAFLMVGGLAWVLNELEQNQALLPGQPAANKAAARGERLAQQNAMAKDMAKPDRGGPGGGVVGGQFDQRFGTAKMMPPMVPGGKEGMMLKMDTGIVPGVKNAGPGAGAKVAGAPQARPFPAPDANFKAMAPPAMVAPPFDGGKGAVAGEAAQEPPVGIGERALRKQGKFAELTLKRLAAAETKVGLGGMVPTLPIGEPFALREYAHEHQTSEDGVRRDFAETLYWHPVLVLPGDKTVSIHFDLSDAVTQFQVQVWGHTLDGRLGAVTTDIASRLPFNVDVKLPTEISSTDTITVPVALANATDKNRAVKLTAEAEKLTLEGDKEYQLPLGPEARARQLLRLKPAVTDGTAKLRLLAQSEPFASDAIERTFKIVPDGFPITGKASDVLEGVAIHKVLVPARDQRVPGTFKLQAQVFPSTLAELQKGLEGMLREPYGCFEQTSSSNYPNVMILDYLKATDQAQPAIENKARDLMARGYTKLASFECVDPKTQQKKEGYEWFGQTAPPHEALTAYGVLQFLDMAKYQPVDPAMIERTKQYLLGQRNGKGGFKRNQRALDSFGRAPDHVTDAYIVWALSEANLKADIELETRTTVATALAKDDPYLLALASLSLLKQGDRDGAAPLLKALAKHQKADGSLTAKETSITHSGGSQLAIETTALATLAWLRANQPADFGESVRKAADWIGKQRGAFGGYGSTQSTVLALKALIAYTEANKKTAEAGELRLYVNDRKEPVAVKAFAAGSLDALVVELPDEDLLQAGENTVTVEITGKNRFPHTLTWSYRAITPANKDVCPVRLTTKLAATKLAEGQTVRVTAAVENVSGKEQGMAVAVVGLPAGLMLPPDMQELRDLVRGGKIDAFEIKGRELILYWRGLAKDAKHEVSLELIAQVPGSFRGPASRAYLYYDADERWWVQPLAAEIEAK